MKVIKGYLPNRIECLHQLHLLLTNDITIDTISHAEIV